MNLRPVLETVIACLACVAVATPGLAGDPYRDARMTMVKEIEDDVRRTSFALDKESLDPRVMDAMASVPRHRLIPDDVQGSAYANRPLPIGHGQTISQPYIVAVMTDLLKTTPSSRVLEVGTGSAYQAAVLSGLVKHVYTIEIIEPLATSAAERLETLGYDNVTVRQGDGYYGWPEHGPFDGIIVTAAGSRIPPPLIDQLKPGGRMILPVGGVFTAQNLVLVTKDDEGHVHTRQVLPVQFVPLTGEH